MTQRLWITAVVAGVLISGLFWIDPLFVPLALVGPPVSGLLAAWRALPLRWIVVVWLVAGLGAVVSDFVVNQEDVVFHLVLTAIMVVLGAAAWWVGDRLMRRRLAVAG